MIEIATSGRIHTLDARRTIRGAQAEETAQRETVKTACVLLQHGRRPGPRGEPEWLERIVNYARSPQGKKLGLAGAIAAGLLTTDQAQEMFGAAGEESPRI